MAMVYIPQRDPVQHRADTLEAAQVALLYRLASAPDPLLLPPGVLPDALGDLVVLSADRRVGLTGFVRLVARHAFAAVWAAS